MIFTYAVLSSKGYILNPLLALFHIENVLMHWNHCIAAGKMHLNLKVTLNSKTKRKSGFELTGKARIANMLFRYWYFMYDHYLHKWWFSWKTLVKMGVPWHVISHSMDMEHSPCLKQCSSLQAKVGWKEERKQNQARTSTLHPNSISYDYCPTRLVWQTYICQLSLIFFASAFEVKVSKLSRCIVYMWK